MREQPEDLFLLTWERISTAPDLQLIEVDDLQEDDWVLFRYACGKLEGLKGGAPLCNVLTEKEADLVRKVWVHIDGLRAEAKRLNKEAKELMDSTLRQFVQQDRKVF